MARRKESFNKNSRSARSQDKLVKQGMVIHETRLPTLDELRDTLDGYYGQSEHFDPYFGVKITSEEEY